MAIGLAMIGALHCAPAYDTSTPPPAGDEPSTSTDEPARAPAKNDDDTNDEPRFAFEAEGLPPSLITSMVITDDGSMYGAGTFTGSLFVGNDRLKSRGEEDVFLVRFNPDNRIAWIRSIGSVRSERAPKVTYSDGKVRILAVTDGQVDCGSGDMDGRWSSEMFFYCLYETNGDAINGGTFPTGSP